MIYACCHAKRLLLGECHRFCMPGTALERRIMAVTPREVQLVAQSVQRRIDAASKRSSYIILSVFSLSAGDLRNSAFRESSGESIWY